MWLLGDNVGDQSTRVQSAADREEKATSDPESTTAHPGAREGAAFWMDESGTGLMFGGKGFGRSNIEQELVLGDLWEFNVLLKRWSLVKINSQELHPGPRHRALGCGVHGIVFVIFGGEDENGKLQSDTWLFLVTEGNWILLNVTGPTARKDSAVWCDRKKLVIFGGESENRRMLNDIWEFSFRQLRWSEVRVNGITPLGRTGAVTWSNHSRNLFMYGGQRVTRAEQGFKISLLSDLWLFDDKRKAWTLLHGDTSAKTNRASYGTQGVLNAQNSPGPRMHSASWKMDDSLWLHGGLTCRDSSGPCQPNSLLADTWMFEHNTSQWVWQSGSKFFDVSPVYGRRKHFDRQNCPGSRTGSIGWSYQGIGFIFGGLGKDGRNRTSYLNDLWLLGKANKTYVISAQISWLHDVPPGVIFSIVLASIAGITLLFGAIFFLKKMMEYSRHRPFAGDFSVRYSPVSQEATLEA